MMSIFGDMGYHGVWFCAHYLEPVEEIFNILLSSHFLWNHVVL